MIQRIKPGKRFCEAGFQNSSDKRRAAEMRCRHGPPARSSERKGFGSTLIVSVA